MAKLTESQLRIVIREELINYLNEDKEVLEEGIKTNILAGIFAALSFVGVSGASSNQAPTSNDIIKMTAKAEQPANEAATIVRNNNIKLSQDGSFSVGDKTIGKFSPNTVSAIKKLNETGANIKNLEPRDVDVKDLYRTIESDPSYRDIETKIKELDDVRTHTQDQKVFIFGIIAAAGLIGLFGSTIATIVQNPYINQNGVGGRLLGGSRGTPSQRRRGDRC